MPQATAFLNLFERSASCFSRSCSGFGAFLLQGQFCTVFVPSLLVHVYTVFALPMAVYTANAAVANAFFIVWPIESLVFFGFYMRSALSVFEDSAAVYRNAYWRLRGCRTSAALRRWYRVAAKEKARLHGLGYPLELIRLYGVWLKAPDREARHVRFLQAFDEFEHGPKQLRLF